MSSLLGLGHTALKTFPKNGLTQAALRPGGRQAAAPGCYRQFHISDTRQEYKAIPQTEPYPGVASPQPSNSPTQSYQTRISKLSNGLTVASESSSGICASIGVVVDAGARYETQDLLGASYFLDRLSYRSTLSKTHEEVIAELEKLGGNFLCTSTRETLMYLGSVVFKDDIETAMALLSEVVLTPAFAEHEVLEQAELTQYEHEGIIDRPESYVVDLLHSAAYGLKTVGKDILPSEDIAKAMTPEKLTRFHKQLYTPQRMVVAASGVDTTDFLKLSEKYFGSAKLPKSSNTVTMEPAKYIGGSRLKHLNESLKNNPLKRPLTYLGIGFEGVSWDDDDLFAVAVIQVLLGGGDAFSAGGPGKGMYSRLYVNVLNRLHWLDSAVASNLSYADTGMFILNCSCPPHMVNEAFQRMTIEFASVMKGIPDVELQRAKNQLKSSLMMNLESKSILFEDIARQVLATGTHLSAEELCTRIDAVTQAEIKAATSRMMKQNISVSGFGNLENLAPYDNLNSYAKTLAEKMESGQQRLWTR